MDPVLFHIQNKYYVEVIKNKLGCVAKFPKNILRNPKLPAIDIEYIITDEGLKIEYEDIKIIEKVPKYAIRLLIQNDIGIKAIQREIHLDLIQYFKGIEPKKRAIDIISVKLSKEEKLLEYKLAENFSDIFFGVFDAQAAENQGILEGFEALVSQTKRNGY